MSQVEVSNIRMLIKLLMGMNDGSDDAWKRLNLELRQCWMEPKWPIRSMEIWMPQNWYLRRTDDGWSQPATILVLLVNYLGCEDERESCLGADRTVCRVLVLPGRKDWVWCIYTLFFELNFCCQSNDRLVQHSYNWLLMYNWLFHALSPSPPTPFFPLHHGVHTPA